MINWKINDTTLKYRNSWIEVCEHQVVFPGGKTGVYGVVSMPDTAAVIARENTDIYLVRQYRFTVNMDSWELPSGHIRKDETPQKAAERELREEAGLKAGKWNSLGFVHPALGVMNSTRYLFLAEQLTAVPTSHEDAEAGMKVEKFPLEKISKMIARNEIFDDYLIAALYKLTAQNDR